MNRVPFSVQSARTRHKTQDTRWQQDAFTTYYVQSTSITIIIVSSDFSGKLFFPKSFSPRLQWPGFHLLLNAKIYLIHSLFGIIRERSSDVIPGPYVQLWSWTNATITSAAMVHQNLDLPMLRIPLSLPLVSSFICGSRCRCATNSRCSTSSKSASFGSSCHFRCFASTSRQQYSFGQHDRPAARSRIHAPRLHPRWKPQTTATNSHIRHRLSVYGLSLRTFLPKVWSPSLQQI